MRFIRHDYTEEELEWTLSELMRFFLSDDPCDQDHVSNLWGDLTQGWMWKGA